MFENGGRFQLHSPLTPTLLIGGVAATFTSLSGVLSVNDVVDLRSRYIGATS